MAQIFACRYAFGSPLLLGHPLRVESIIAELYGEKRGDLNGLSTLCFFQFHHQ
ncbi:hypothetical protein KP509_11G058500 [Ceratopteris richardii]|uniref:Uncharacterized protein n=1 Tax=Ceratopteris richardii TaxID=49495 RepID=A0A8T2TQ64_CERRI|nr:hypothetical protein KP509_11G058500 [Ceratopteris richardii]